jgi:hypothetical protein
MTVKISKPAINVREELADLRKPTGIAGEAMLRAETPQEQFNLIGAGRRRLTINGDMRIAQRGTSATGVTSNGYYATDRMNFYKTNTGTYTISQSTDAPSGFTYSHKVVSTTGDGSLGSTDLVSPLFYSIEGHDLQHLGYGTTDGKYITLSFWVKTNVTGTYSVSFYKTHSSARVCAPLYTIQAANTWQYVSLTVPSDSVGIANGTGGGLYLYFNTTVGSTYNSQPTTAWTAYNSSNWAGGHTAHCFASNNDSWQITGVQLELGKVATPFEHRSYGEELALCQRYYQVGTFVGNGGTDLGDTNPTVSWMPQTAMRATASMGVRDDNAAVNRYTDPTSGSVSWVYGGPSHRADNISFSGSYANGIDQGLFVLDLGNTSSGVGSWIRFHWYADAEL